MSCNKPSLLAASVRAFYHNNRKATKRSSIHPGPLHFTKSKRTFCLQFQESISLKAVGRGWQCVQLPTAHCSSPWACREWIEGSSWPHHLRTPVGDPVGVNTFLHLPPFTFNSYINHHHSEIPEVNFVSLTRLLSSFLFYFYGIYI